MKKLIIFSLVILPVILFCQKNDTEKLTVNITSGEWYATADTFNNNRFCHIHLKVSGTSNAELLAIETYGDGLAGCKEIKCNPGQSFSDDVEICFFPLRDTISRKFGTTIIAYASRIKPGEPKFCEAVGSGETVLVKLESPVIKWKSDLLK
jgi:hypothetical protein